MGRRPLADPGGGGPARRPVRDALAWTVAGILLLGIGLAVAAPSIDTSRVSRTACTICRAKRTETVRGLWVLDRPLARFGSEVRIREDDPEGLRWIYRGGHAHRWEPDGSARLFFGLTTGFG